MFERSALVDLQLPLKGAYDSRASYGELNSVILQQVIEMALEPVDGGAWRRRC